MEANDIAIKVTMRDLIHHQIRSVPGFTDMVRSDAKIRNSRMDMTFGPAIATGHSSDIVRLLDLMTDESGVIVEGQNPRLDAPVLSMTLGELVRRLAENKTNKTNRDRIAAMPDDAFFTLQHMCGRVTVSVADVKTILAAMRIKGEL